MALPNINTAFEDELGCLSYCLEFESSTASRETAAALSAQHTPVADRSSTPPPPPLYFCLSPTCMTPSESAADHSAICSRLSMSGTLCADHESELASALVDSYPLEKVPLLGSAAADVADLESQICDRSRPLGRCASPDVGWYQASLRFLSARPRDGLLVLSGLFITLVALIALTLLVFIMVMDARGELGAVVASVDSWLAHLHHAIIHFLQAFGGLEPTYTKLTSVTR